MSDHSIIDHMASYYLYKTLDLISEDFSISRVVRSDFFNLIIIDMNLDSE